MSSELDKVIVEIQRDLWKGYSETVIDHALNPRNVGQITNADGIGTFTGPCGDTMKIWLKVKDGTIAEATFLTNGCGTTLATGSMITELAKGKEVREALRISSDDVLNVLGGLPEESLHCAALAASALKMAINDFFAYIRDPWKRAYQRRDDQ
ncbi:MAG: iron-sulfur cluster assembly scaffold protein [Deltaproteobacteria bacterium]|nr:iron-sulfur cluster assembly scaffold protein [Deltaproteobacteria bacterium]